LRALRYCRKSAHITLQLWIDTLPFLQGANLINIYCVYGIQGVLRVRHCMCVVKMA
jgi:hypothetical protein